MPLGYNNRGTIIGNYECKINEITKINSISIFTSRRQLSMYTEDIKRTIDETKVNKMTNFVICS